MKYFKKKFYEKKMDFFYSFYISHESGIKSFLKWFINIKFKSVHISPYKIA